MDWKLLLAFVVPLLGLAVTWGSMQTTGSEHRRMLDQHEVAIGALEESRAKAEWVSALTARVERLEEGRTKVEGLAERVASSQREAADAKALATKLQDRALARCNQGDE